MGNPRAGDMDARTRVRVDDWIRSVEEAKAQDEWKKKTDAAERAIFRFVSAPIGSFQDVQYAAAPAAPPPRDEAAPRRQQQLSYEDKLRPAGAEAPAEPEPEAGKPVSFCGRRAESRPPARAVAPARARARRPLTPLVPSLPQWWQLFDINVGCFACCGPAQVGSPSGSSCSARVIALPYYEQSCNMTAARGVRVRVSVAWSAVITRRTRARRPCADWRHSNNGGEPWRRLWGELVGSSISR